MEPLFDRRFGDRRLIAVMSQRADGDVHPRRVATRSLAARQDAVAGGRWVMIDQRHGTDIVVTDATDATDAAPSSAGPCWPLAGVGDVALTSVPRQRMAVWAADCAPLAVFGDRGTVLVVHGGWRGLAAGVIDIGLGALTARGEVAVAAVLGAVIHPCCYAFGADDRTAVAQGVGCAPDDLLAITTDGRPALDVPAAVGAALARNGVALDVVGPCTGCDERWFSHRVRHDRGRHALVAWNVPAGVAR